LVTLGNTICGFASIAFACDSKFESAAWMVLLAMVFDALDGKVARMTRSMSAFGGQLDSLSDAVSFGMAPAILIFQFGRSHSDVAYSSKVLWLACAFYAACAVIRLARFNVEHAPDAETHEIFYGLPSPGAAGFLSSLVLCFFFLRDMPGIEPASGKPPLADTLGRSLWFMPKTLLYVLPFLAVGCATLMVSRLSYVHVLNRFLAKRKPLFQLVQIALILLCVLAIGPEVSAFVGFFFYVVSGIVSYYFARRRHTLKKGLTAVKPQHTADALPGEAREMPS
jgi:CDP-diacylglycerol--serine O-phosphatidyltransferase